MGSCTSNEQESNASSTRLQSGPSGRGLNEDLDRVERETEKERTEEERVANSQPIAITATDPPPGVTVEIGEAATVLAFLKKVALLLGLDESDAPSLQMLFSEAILAHELELKAAGLCDESLCSVLGVEERLEAKAEAKAKAVNIVTAAEENRLADVQLVCQHAPEKVNDKDEFGFSALHKAAAYNSLAVAELLVQAKADVNVKDNGEFSALHAAAYSNSLAVAELLVQAKADVHAKNMGGASALHWAAENNSLAVAELLVQAKADVDAKNNGGQSALRIAGRNQDMITLLSQ